MKILMLGWELPPYNSGGLGVACLGLAKALANKGAKITFVMPKKQDLNYDFMDIVYAEIDDDDSELFKNSYVTNQSFLLRSQLLDPFPPDYVRSAIKFAEKIKKIAMKMKADVIHAHDWMTYDAGIAASEVLGKPLVVHIHNTVFDRGVGNYNSYEYEIEKRGFEKADEIIAVSNFTKNIVAEKYGIDRKKITTVHNGVENLKRKKLAPALMPLKELGYKIVLFLGRITIQKGPDYFIRAAKKVLEFNPKVAFVIVGDGDMQGQIMSLAASLGIADKIIFTGFLRGDEKHSIFQAADLFVMPSVSEPFGIVPLEAIANGTPALVSKQSGVSETLSHALKTDFWDIDEMANKILAVLEHDGLSHDLINESSKELPNISWNNAADKCLDVYAHLAGGYT
jgi:glycosyltransferase involved in cell wall biosynthesis